MTHTELVFRGTFGHILVAYIKKVVCQPCSVLNEERKNMANWINRSPSFSRLYDFKTRRFVNWDGDLQPTNIYDAVSHVM